MKMKNQKASKNRTHENLFFQSTEDLQNIEHVDSRVSKKYVPIFTTEIIEILSPEWEFIGGKQFVKGLSKHYVDLTNDDGDLIRIYNSYDRSLALSVSLVSDGLGIDLGVDRLIHIGHKAKEFTEDLKLFKDDIAKGIVTAKKIDAFLKTAKVTPRIQKEISNIIYRKEADRKGFQSYTNYVDVLVEKKSIKNIKAYILKSLELYYDGEYTITVSGVKKDGRKTKSYLRIIADENRIYTYLEENFPEYFI